MKALKAFIKPFEVPQRNVKQKFVLIFILRQLSEMHGASKYPHDLVPRGAVRDLT